jgi:hypothetical protein
MRVDAAELRAIWIRFRGASMETGNRHFGVWIMNAHSSVIVATLRVSITGRYGDG